MATSTNVITKDYLLTQLKNFDSKILEEKYASLDTIKIKKLTTPTAGFLASYQLTVDDGATHLGDVIDIPKDWLLKGVSIETCSTPDVPVAGYKVGDKYFDFAFNTKDTETGSETTTHQYLLITELAQAYTNGDGIAISADNKISVDIGDGLEIDASSKKVKLSYETTDIDFDTEW